MSSSASSTSSRYIAITGLVYVRDSEVPDPKQPRVFKTFCDFQLRQDGTLTMAVLHYSPSGAPERGSIAFVSGDLWFPAGDEDELVDASAFNIVAPPDPAQADENDEDSEDSRKIKIPPASVCAVGFVEATIDRDWTISVATYDRVRRTTRSFMFGIHIPESGRFKNLRAPTKGSAVSVRGVALGVNSSELGEIELEAVTFISMTDGSHSSYSGSRSSSQSSNTAPLRTGARSKRDLRLERQETPMKKIKIGPPPLFLSGSALEDFTGVPAKEDRSSTPSLSD